MTISTIVQNASRNAIDDSLDRLKTDHFPRSRWLGVRNRYSTNTTERIGNDHPNSLKPKQASDYIAASVVLHCQDGWGFLSRAVDSLIDGDVHTSAHMAYYAELRAVMSFFASEGIGVFDRRHVWFDASGIPAYSDRKGTHKFVQEGFDAWAAEPSKAGKLMDLITVDSISLSVWINAAAAGLGIGTFTQLAQYWLKTWGMDLNVLKDDQDVRNLSSYRPHELMAPKRPNVKKTLETILSFWEACVPTNLSRFELLDLHLLRSVIEKTYSATTGYPCRGAGYKAYVDKALMSVGAAGNTELGKFLKKSISPNKHSILVEAEKAGISGSRVIRPISMIARAILLLRFATASASDFLSRASVNKSDLKFWWRVGGIQTGLWSIEESPENMADLWNNVSDCLPQVREWLASSSTSNGVLDSRRSVPFELWELSKFQMAGYWGIWD